MLESLNIKKVATYSEEGIQITGLKKINFIYGANGSGKTTLTKVIARPGETQFANCSMTWQGGQPLTALVYNKDFKTANFGKGSIDGVFTLGQATKQEIEAIAKMTGELDEIKEKGLNKKGSLEKVKVILESHQAEYREKAWSEIYKAHEKIFKDAFSGYIKSKEAFRIKLIEEFKKNTAEVKTYDDLSKRAETIFGEQPVAIASIAKVDFLRLAEIENDEIWAKKIIGKSDVEIAKLIQRLNLNDWVNQGRAYLQNDPTCPFCQQQTISEEFKKQLEDYFDESFTNDTKRTQELSEEYLRIAQNTENILNVIEQTEKQNTGSKLNLASFSAYLKTLASQFVSNKELLSGKMKEPSRSIQLVLTQEQCESIEGLITDANTAIAAHNLIVSNFPKEKTQLIIEVWKYIIEHSKKQIASYVKKENGLNAGIEALNKQIEGLQKDYIDLRNKIRLANKNVTSVQPSVDEINRLLKLYGFTNFEIVPSKENKNQYQILRSDGTIAESTLSEGEVTFITFLYFMQLAKGSTKEENISEERILVIDDPISSLDSNILFVVSTLVKEVIKALKNSNGNIKQLILLTHNVYFHKEVSFIDGRTKTNSDTLYWILRKNENITQIQAFETLNPINTSYELLWRELLSKNNSGITTQNLMRRIIESYFKLVGKYGDDDLINSFSTKEEQEICRSLICWINDGSHGVSDDLYVERQDATVDKFFDVFKRIFTQMKHQEHYEMMTSVMTN